MAAFSHEAKLEEILKDLMEETPGMLGHRLFEAKCESPIEEIMFLSLYARFILRNFPLVFLGHEVNTNYTDSYGLLQLYSQVQISDYRVDFLLRMSLAEGASVNFVIECDGHEFHERTKEQAARDRARDRKLQSLGYTVFRFTGSEIWRSPANCAYEIMGAFCKKVNVAMLGEEE